MRIASSTDVGRVREHNEDALLVLPERGLVAVADGLGGHAAGEVASRLAVEALERELTADRLSGSAEEVGRVLAEVLRSADRDISADGDRDPARSGMGTTAVVAALRDRAAVLAHVGDSRAYHCSGGRLEQVTRDHARGGFLTQALGVTPAVEPDVLTVELRRGDILLLCTDGLSGMVEDDELAALLAEGGDPEQICARLVRAALDRGGLDNVTVVVVQA